VLEFTAKSGGMLSRISNHTVLLTATFVLCVMRTRAGMWILRYYNVPKLAQEGKILTYIAEMPGSKAGISTFLSEAVCGFPQAICRNSAINLGFDCSFMILQSTLYIFWDADSVVIIHEQTEYCHERELWLPRGFGLVTGFIELFDIARDYTFQFTIT
jgi:hypothetical protein